MSLGEKILQLRKAKGLSQEQLADILNVSRQSISKWETDQSLPEIEKILALSRTFSITTDELLGNDAAGPAEPPPTARAGEERAGRSDVVRWVKGLLAAIDSRLLWMAFALLCFIGAGVCVIVNLAINRRVTWAAYPLLSIALALLTATPLFFKKYTVALCVASAMVHPFLYWMDRITPAPDWYFRLGFPCAAAGTAFLWAAYLLFRFAKISIWYKAAISLFLGGMVVSPLINYFAHRFVGAAASAFDLDFAANTFAYAVASAVLWMVGYWINKKKLAQK